jgi:hypothetical protein
VVFDVGKNMKAAASAGFGECFGDGIDSASLRTAYYPRQVILFSQFSYLQKHRLDLPRY